MTSRVEKITAAFRELPRVQLGKYKVEVTTDGSLYLEDSNSTFWPNFHFRLPPDIIPGLYQFIRENYIINHEPIVADCNQSGRDIPAGGVE